MHRSTLRSVTFLIAIATATVATAAAEAQTRTVKRFGDWRVLAHDNAADSICFAIATPKTSEPPAASAGAFFYISAWPKDGVRAEISVKTTAALKPGAPASIAIDKTFYKLFSKGDRAFVIDATDELKLLDAMKKGSTVMVIAQSDQGTVTRDIYSLSGISQALQSVSSGCK